VATAVVVAVLVGSCLAMSTAAVAKAVPRTFGEVPPANPKHSLALDEHLRPDCSGVHDDSPICLDESVAMLNAGRHDEQLGPLVLPGNWNRLTVPEQLFVITELERTARGLQPDTGLAADWNAAARAGADAGEDPTTAGSGAHGLESVWAGGNANPITATVGWIYDDALFPDGSSSNLDCSASSPAGCWGHRDVLLHDTAATACRSRCAVGAGYSPDGFTADAGSAHESYAEVFGVDGGNNPDPLMFRWTSELRYLPACEQAGDTCGWKGRPLVTPKGFVNVRGVPAGELPPIQPWFPVTVRWDTTSRGKVSVSVTVAGASVAGLEASARQGTTEVTLAVKRVSTAKFVASGRLSAGRWTATIVYRTAPGHGPSPSTVVPVTVPGG
jgi:hypothetical protein